MTDERVTLRVATLGRRWDSVKKKLYFSLAPIRPDGTLADAGYYDAKKFRSVGVGAIYEVQGTPDGSSIATSTLKWTGDRWPDEAAAAEWVARDRAATAERDLESRFAKEKENDAMVRALEPIRRAWQASSPSGRVAIEAQVLALLRRKK